MTAMPEPPGFQEWLDGISHSADDPDPGEVSDSWRVWLLDFFVREGPVSKEVVTDAAMHNQLALANKATELVFADLHRTTALRPDVSVFVAEESDLRLRIDGSEWSMFMLPDVCQAVAEIADYLQEHLSQRFGMWPTCPEHGFGLHTYVREGRAMWRCRRSRGEAAHIVANIGELGADG